ncbi:unnamed protein product [Urochloa humidicola]
MFSIRPCGRYGKVVVKSDLAEDESRVWWGHTALNQSYICNVWRTGLAVSRNADGIVTKEELRSKVEQVVGDAEIRERARLFKDAAWQSVSEGGSSNDNFKKLVSLLSE